jgi:hypothetical protein
MVVDSSLGVFDYSMPRLVYNKALLGAMMGKYTESAGNLNRVRTDPYVHANPPRQQKSFRSKMPLTLILPAK